MGLIRILARKSDLARLQAYLVGLALGKKHPSLKVEYSFRESLGDQNQEDPLWKMPEKGVFTEDFVRDLRDGHADIVVHSWKDLPTHDRAGSEIAATLPRADQRDLLLMKKSSWNVSRVRVLSSSPRRAHHLAGFLPTVLPWQCESVTFESVRGNIPTRLRKWREGSADGLIVAKAALDRLLETINLPMAAEFAEARGEIAQALMVGDWMALPLSENPNAAAQGALAIEIRSHRQDLRELLSAVQDKSTFHAVTQERKRLAELGGGCHQKIGIAVLPRGTSQVWIERGVTDSGQILERREWQSERRPPVFPASALWTLPDSAERQVIRRPCPVPDHAPEGGLWIARVSAWPEKWTSGMRTANQVVWAAGVRTWQKLAQKGVWVHGCSEGLGEQEDPRTQTLRPVSAWTKLTHQGAGMTAAASSIAVLPTYQLDLAQIDFQISDSAQFFYWRSGSQFRAALQRSPQIRSRYHASGPGSTQSFLLEELGPERVYCFLNEDDWRSQCQNPKNFSPAL